MLPMQSFRLTFPLQITRLGEIQTGNRDNVDSPRNIIALTLGDEVGAVVTAAVACGQPKVPLWKDAGYASLLGITGELLVSMVAVLQEGAEVVPAATGE